MQSLSIISVNFWQIVISFANLALLTWIVKKFLFKPVKKVLDSRREAIDAGYARAEQAQAEAEENRKHYAAAMEAVKQTTDQMISDAARSAERRGGEIEAELTREGQPFRTDESNGNTAYTRNFLRLQIIPMLQKNVNAAAQANIARAAGEALEAREYIEGKVRECCEKCVSNRGAFRCADLSALAAEAPFLQRQVLYRMVAEAAGKRKDITSAHIDL